MPNFYQDVIRPDPRFGSLKRTDDINLLEPVTRAAVLAIVEDALTLGVELTVFETYRSQNRQQELFNQGASKLKTVGVHHFGLACDLVKVAAGEPCWKGDFSFLGTLARAHGLLWGGDWGDPLIHHTFIDAVHVQRCAVSMQPALFSGSFYPDAAYDPYARMRSVKLA
ncbi:MAG: M15 family metallopeptidase [Acidobacteriia bacterium]|nr:M15 family metallopeptidase [Terriglobia bacterium]